MNETTTQHTCHGAVFCGTPRPLAEVECPACTPNPVPATGEIVCQECGQRHEATYSHEGRFGEGPIYAVVCTEDGLTAYYTGELLEVTAADQLATQRAKYQRRVAELSDAVNRDGGDR